MRENVRLTAIAVILLLASSAACWAQATRTWVSGVGDDANPCSRTAPCKTFAGAISKTSTGGEINVIDPGGFGAVTITQSVSIIAEGFTGGVLVSGTNGIIINAGASDKVLLRGLDIDGLGTGLSGISVMQASEVEIQNCQVYGFMTAGVSQSTNSPSRVHILNSQIFANTNGIVIQGGSSTNTMAVESTSLDHNTSANAKIGGSAVLQLDNSSLKAAPAAVAITGGSPTVQTFRNNRIGGSVPTLTPIALQ